MPPEYAIRRPPFARGFNKTAWRERLGAPLLLLIAAALVPAPSAGAAHLLRLPLLCPFRALTGLPCPGCGMTRALVCLAHGHVGESLAFHPLGIAVVTLLVVAAAIRLFQLPMRFAPKTVSAVTYGVSAALLIVWAARLGHLLPNPP